MPASYVASSYVHTTGTSGSLGAAVQAGDVVIVMARDISGRHATATDSSGANTYTEQAWVSDGASGAITGTCLTFVATTGYTPSIVVGSGNYFDAWAIRGLTNGTKNSSGFFKADLPSPNLIANTGPTNQVCTLAIGFFNSSDNWTGWSQGSGGNAIAGTITNLGHSAAQITASGYQLGIASGTYNPGITVTGGSSRTCVLGVFFNEASASSKLVLPININQAVNRAGAF